MSPRINHTVIAPFPTYLWFLTLSYSMVIVLANWFDARLVKFGDLVTDAGTLIFPLTFLLSDVITEVYGYKHARRAIWVGFLFNAIFMLYGQLIIHLPSPHYATDNQLFNRILTLNARIIFASVLSYLCAEPLNSYLMATLKLKMRGKMMWLRFVASTVIACAGDSLLFTLIAFYTLLSFSHLAQLMLDMWLIKICVEIILLPLSLKTAIWLKKSEKLDIYDTHTRFNLFRFDGKYAGLNNHFHETTPSESKH